MTIPTTNDENAPLSPNDKLKQTIDKMAVINDVGFAEANTFIENLGIIDAYNADSRNLYLSVVQLIQRMSDYEYNKLSGLEEKYIKGLNRI